MLRTKRPATLSMPVVGRKPKLTGSLARGRYSNTLTYAYDSAGRKHTGPMLVTDATRLICESSPHPIKFENCEILAESASPAFDSTIEKHFLHPNATSSILFSRSRIDCAALNYLFQYVVPNSKVRFHSIEFIGRAGHASCPNVQIEFVYCDLPQAGFPELLQPSLVTFKYSSITTGVIDVLTAADSGTKFCFIGC